MLAKILINSIRYAKNNLVIGSSTKIDDLQETAGWSYFAWWRAYSYSKYLKNKENKWELNKDTRNRRIHPIQMVDNVLAEDPYGPFSELLSAFIVSSQLRMGNCGDHSVQVYCFLWQMATRYGRASGIKRVEILSFDDLDHQLVVVNRNINSDPKNLATWGFRDCRVIDAWWEKGKILTGNGFYKEFNKLTDYCQLQDKSISQLLGSSEEVRGSLSFSLTFDLKPSTLKFPENIDQFITFNALDFDLSLIEVDLEDEQAKHRSAFTTTLDIIKERASLKSITVGLRKLTDLENKICGIRGHI